MSSEKGAKSNLEGRRPSSSASKEASPRAREGIEIGRPCLKDEGAARSERMYLPP